MAKTEDEKTSGLEEAIAKARRECTWCTTAKDAACGYCGRKLITMRADEVVEVPIPSSAKEGDLLVAAVITTEHKKCETCWGSGKIYDMNVYTCPDCHGTGCIPEDPTPIEKAVKELRTLQAMMAGRAESGHPSVSVWTHMLDLHRVVGGIIKDLGGEPYAW